MDKIACRRRVGAVRENQQAAAKNVAKKVQVKEVVAAPRRVLGDVSNQKGGATGAAGAQVGGKPQKKPVTFAKPRPRLLEQSVSITLTRRMEPLTLTSTQANAQPERAEEASELACRFKGIFNIDLEADPQLAARYVKDIMNYLKQLETKYPVEQDYMHLGHRCTKTMRTVLVNWMSEVCQSFKFLKESFYLSVSLLDRYLQRKAGVGKDTLQLVGCVCMFVASKYEENIAPEVADFVYISDDSFQKADVFGIERDLLVTVGFALGRPTPITFLRRFSKVNQSPPKAHELAKYLLELLQLEYELCHVPPSMQAAAACCLSLSLCRDVPLTKAWSDALAHYSGYRLSELTWIIYELAQVAANVPYSEYKQIYRLYASAKALHVSQDRLLTGDRLAQLAKGAVVVKSLK